MNVPSHVVTVVRIVVDLLVRRQYETLARVDIGARLSADDIRQSVAGYGRTLVRPPDDAWSSLDAVAIFGTTPPAYDVVFDLWTAEEGRSDLSIELRVVPQEGGVHAPEILDIHTL
jgi:hypothetical protein